MNDLALPGLVIPGVIVAAASGLFSAVWSWLAQRDVQRLSGRLAEQGILLGAMAGGRVSAAVTLWAETAAFEQALEDLLADFHDLTLDEDASREERRLAFAAHEARAARRLGRLFPKLMRATATAECLLGDAAGGRSRRLAQEYSAAHAGYWASRAEEGGDAKRRARAAAREALRQARATRAGLLGELRVVLRTAQG